MKAYSEDPRQKAVVAIERGMPKARAGRAFGVGISAVKRHAIRTRRGGSLGLAKAPGKLPKMDERVGKCFEERPFVTFSGLFEHVRAVSGASVSRSTMCRAIARVGSTRKEGQAPRSEASSRGRLGG